MLTLTTAAVVRTITALYGLSPCAESYLACVLSYEQRVSKHSAKTVNTKPQFQALFTKPLTPRAK